MKKNSSLLLLGFAFVSTYAGAIIQNVYVSIFGILTTLSIMVLVVVDK